MNGYQERKARVIEAMKHRSEGIVRLGKDTSNLFRATKNDGTVLNVRDFNHVLQVNTEEGWAEVEGMTTFEAYVHEALKYGVVPAVSPELKSITVGGAVSGIGIESSCFKYGFVHETVLEMDVLVGTGEVVTCSPTQNSDLFHAIANSYGTLGYVLRVKAKVVPAKKYVEITREKYSDYTEYVNALTRYSLESREKGTYDYVDGLVFNKNEMYLMLGNFTDNAPFVSDYTYMDIYYKSMDKPKDYLKTADYIFRYDTDWFWTTKAMGLENPILRRLFGRKRLRSDVYYKLTKKAQRFKIPQLLNIIHGTKFETLIQDAEVLVKDAPEFLEWFQKEITDRKPLTIAAVIPFSKTAHFTLFPMDPNEVYMNIGYYAAVDTTHEEGYYNRLFEKKLMELGAKKMMYSTSYYTKEEFWNIFDKASYDTLKQKYDPNGAFPNLYNRVVKGV